MATHRAGGRSGALGRARRTAELGQGETPIVSGVRPHLSVMVDLATIRNAPDSAAGQLSWIGPITTNESQLIGCDAIVSRIITDGPSEILDVGQTTRTIPPPLRRAVIARDRTGVARL
ncbi:MAG TPA: DUF222 domain-containing protein, partial [Actinomycetes bacterium]|nr:DUF222 domain-containing protein [Actinomycetes bacterium]